ncbi:MAG: membrane protein insertase YidC, partial [Acidobacteriota bacterium]
MKSSEDADIERRLLIAILLSIAILFGTPYIYQKIYPPPPEEAVPPVTEQTSVPKPPAPSEAVPEQPKPEARQVRPTTSESAVATTAQVREITVESDSLILRFRSQGAELVGAKLKDYLGSNKEPLELVPQILPAEYPRPLALKASQGQLQNRLQSAVYEASGAASNHLSAPVDLVFEYRKDDLWVRKTISIPQHGYDLKVKVEATEDGEPLTLGVVLG